MIDVDWLRQRYVSDRAPVTLIAAEAGVDVSTVYRTLRTAGLTGRGRTAARKASWGETLTADFCREHQGESARAIARMLGCDHATVRYWRARRGYAEPPTRREAAELRRWYVRDGESIPAVARKLGISPREATLRLAAAGVPIRDVGRRRQ